MTLVAIRGATTLDEDTSDEVIRRTRELITEILDRNEILATDVVSIVFTASPDITSEFPALAVRVMGYVDIPLLCAREMAVSGAMALCVRCLLHVDLPGGRSAVRHVYLRAAQRLRPDLADTQ